MRYNSQRMDWIKRLTLFLPFVGLAIAGYLSIAKMTGLDAACGSAGCSTVALWVEQNMGGFPIAYIGVFGYLVLIILGLFGLITKKVPVKPGLIISGFGAATSLVLMILSFAVIKATCPWCIGSAVTMCLIFAAYMILNRGAETSSPGGIDYGIFGVGFVGAILAMMGSINSFKDKIPDNVLGPIENYFGPNPKIYGDPKAEIAIVEFFDFTCPYCKQSFPHFKEMIDKSNGRAMLVMRQFPFVGKEGHEMAAPAAVIGEMCHEKGKFMEYAELVLAMDKSIVTFDKLVECAQKVGLDPEQVRKRANDAKDSAYQLLDVDLKAAHGLGVQITPTYLVGKKGGARVDILLFNNVIDFLTGVRYGLPRPAGL